MKKARFVTLLVVLLLVVSVFSITVQAKTTLRWWAPNWTEAQAEKIAAAFEAQHPDVDVQIEFQSWEGMHDKILVALKGGNPPDVINVAISWNVPYAALGLLRSLDEHVGKELIKSDFFPGPWNTAVYNGSLYGVPYRSESIGMFYNKEMFREAGLDPSRGPDTWDELLEFSKKLTVDKDGDGEVEHYGFGLVGDEPNNVMARLLPMIWQNNGAILNDDYTKSELASEATIEAVRFYTDFYTKHKVAPKSTITNNGREVERLFANRKVAIMYTGQYAIPPLQQDAPDLEFGTGVLPKKYNRRSMLGGWNIVIPKAAKHPDLAWEFIKFFVQPENMAAYTVTFPALKEAAEYPRFDDPLLTNFLKQLEYAQANPTIPQWAQIEKVVLNEVQYILLGRKTPEKAMQDAARQVDEMLNY